MKHFLKKPWFWILLSLIAILLPIFKNINYFSSNSEILSAFWSLSSSLLLGYFAWATYQHTKTLEKPLLIFERVKDSDDNSYYIIKNVGQVPAINVLLFIRPTDYNSKRPEYEEMILCGAIKTNEYKAIVWQKKIKKLAVVYEDFARKRYTSISDNDYTAPSNGDQIGFDHRGKNKKKVQIYYEENKEHKRTLWRYDDKMDKNLYEMAKELITKITC
jgi:hypothetical protein